MTQQRDLLRDSHERLRLELELLRRRIFVAKAERVDTAQLELEFAATLAALDRLGGKPPSPTLEPSGAPPAERKPRKPTGRRDLHKLPLEEERVEMSDPLFDQLVAEGKAERIGFEESCRLAWKRGGMRRLVLARVKYRAVDVRGESVIETAPMPPECFPRSLAAPSLLAHVLVDKFCDGLPFNRIEERLARDGVSVDRGTMCRWAEDAGATVGATVVAAARAEAWRTAFCIATDATGVAVQPLRRPDKKRQACRRGHFFVLIADRDHIFFEYTAKETSLFVAGMLRGYSGYVQADAKSVYDVLFRERGKRIDDAEADVRQEVGCWSHGRRGFWEAASAKSEIGREGLARIGHFFDLEDAWRGSPPEKILSLRRQHLRPHMEAFFAWA
ncbi:MAG TPA: transposase, partial [Polyangia bacterium]